MYQNNASLIIGKLQFKGNLNATIKLYCFSKRTKRTVDVIKNVEPTKQTVSNTSTMSTIG